jgi:hypothetical protein
LDTVYLAQLGPMVMQTGERGRLTNRFMSSYLNRNFECMSCHTTHYSTTDGVPRNGDWDRYVAPHRVDLEGTVFSWNDGEDHYYGGDAVNVALDEGAQDFSRHVTRFFADQVRADDGVRPWGMDDRCVTLDGQVGLEPTPDINARMAIGGLEGEQLGVLQLIDTFGHGLRTLDPRGHRREHRRRLQRGLSQRGCVG